MRTKWKNLRDQLRKELKKQADRMNEGLNIPSTWQYFNKMSFLKEQMLKKIGQGHLTQLWENDGSEEGGVQNDPIGVDSLWDSTNITNTSEEHNDNAKFEIACDGTTFQSNHVSDTQDVSSYQPPSKRLKPSVEDFNMKYLELEERKMSLLEKSTRSSDPISANDEDYLFFASLVPHMQNLSMEQKMRVRMKIQECIFNEAYVAPVKPIVKPKSKPKPTKAKTQISEATSAATDAEIQEAQASNEPEVCEASASGETEDMGDDCQIVRLTDIQTGNM